MMQAPQTQMPPELSALLTLAQGMQQGRVAPATPEGQPTVAGQMMQQAQQQPGMQDAAMRAGLGAQQQQAQQEQAMQQLPQQVQQLEQRQQAMEQGIAGAPGASSVRMAGGGIVGFAEGGMPDNNLGGTGGYRYNWPGPSAERDRLNALPTDALEWLLKKGKAAVAAFIKGTTLEEIAETVPDDMGGPQRSGWKELPPGMDDLPIPDVAVQPDGSGSARSSDRVGIASGPIQLPKYTAPAGGAAKEMFERAEKQFNALENPNPSPDAVLAEARKRREADAAWMRETGNDPDQQAKDIAAAQERAAYRQSDLDKRRADLNYRDAKEPLTDFLINFDARKGAMGEGFASGARAMKEGVGKRRGEGAQLSELEFQYQDAAAKEQQALRAAKLATDMGHAKAAETALREASQWANTKRIAGAKLYGDRAGELEKSEVAREGHAVDLYKVQAQAKIQEAENASRERMARVAADAASGRSNKNPYDQISDNVRQRFDAWLKAQAAMFQTPTAAQQDAYRQQLLKDELDFARSMGVKVPDAPPGPSAPAGGQRIKLADLPG